MIDWLDALYSKLPNLGRELRDFIVKILPILILIAGVLVTFASIVDILGTPFISVFTGPGQGFIFQRLMIVNVLGIIGGIFMIASFRGLRKKSKKGWRLVFWSQIIWVISALISFSPSFILGLLVLYPLFQVRDSYK